MKESDLLQNERIEYSLRPHPLSFFGRYLIATLVFVWSILAYYFLKWTGTYDLFPEDFEQMSLYLWTWTGGILALGVIISVRAIEWKYFLYYLVLLLVGWIIMLRWQILDLRFVFAYSFLGTLIGIVSTEMVRRSHQFFLTNRRLLLQGGVFNKFERAISHDNITDVSGRQSLMGRAFKYGSLTPITASGFGLGADQSGAGGAVGPSSRVTGIPVLRRFSYFFGGGRSRQTPRTRSYYELFGVHPYAEVRKTFLEKVREFSRSSQSEKQVEIQEQILEELRKRANK